MHAKLARQLAQRLVVPQRRQGYSRLERRLVSLPHALLAHARELLKWVLQPRILHLKLAPSFWGPPHSGVASLGGFPGMSSPVPALKPNSKTLFGPVCGTNAKRFAGSSRMACAFSAVGRLCTGR